VDLQQVSPSLAALAATAVPMPGHTPGGGGGGSGSAAPSGANSAGSKAADLSGAVTIAGMDNVVTILKTKTRPKKLVLLGNDGRRYTYLLKARLVARNSDWKAQGNVTGL